MKTSHVVVLSALVLVFSSVLTYAWQTPKGPPISGRWDLTIHDPQGVYPSWLEITLSGNTTLVGRFVGHFGSSRPIGEVLVKDGHIKFSLPVQWERRKSELVFQGTLLGDKLSGNTMSDKGTTVKWNGVRAPILARQGPVGWGKPEDLFNHKDISGWKGREGKRHGWVVENGNLVNKKPGVDIVTDRKFTDFKLHAEFKYPKGSNSGIYLRGRYEAQIVDEFGTPPNSHGPGGIYGFLDPRVNAAKRPDEWQTYDLTLIGRRVTVVLNGEIVIDRQEIPGITGGALDSDEGSPGPLLIQGDHGKVEFRKITITPAK